MGNAKNIDQTGLMKYFQLFVFLLLVIGVGSVIGVTTAPADWYAGLNKPPFNPPNWIFAPVWLVLYVFIAIAGWRIWRREATGIAMIAWVTQLAFNWLWSPVFFALHLPWPALAVILVVLGAIALFVFQARKIDKLASWLFVPYLAWVSFATLLNASIAILN